MLGIVINPKSGKRIFRAQRLYLWKVLKKRNQAFAYRVTKYIGHAIELGRELVELGYDEILVLGGDGTLSEVINGIMTANIDEEQRKRIRFGIMPRGTGNDWGRFWHITKNYKRSISIFFSGTPQPVDVGCLSYCRNGEIHKRYFINSLGAGLDAHTCDYAIKLKSFLGSHHVNYHLGLIMSFLLLEKTKIKITTDGDEVFEDRFLTLAIANGPFSGGGIKQVPRANPTDGILHGTVVAQLPFKQILKGLLYLFKKKFDSFSFVTSLKGKKMEIKQKGHTKLEVDGIIIDFMGGYTVECLPNALNMIRPNE